MPTRRVSKRVAALVAAVGVVAALALVVSWLVQPHWQSTTVQWWSVRDGEPTTLLVCVDSATDHEARVQVSESATTVTVVGQTLDTTGWGPSVGTGLLATVEVHLKAPIGDRQVVDQDGHPVPQQTP